MKVFSMSQRIYYKDLEPEAESIIKKDLEQVIIFLCLPYMSPRLW